jgi:hypothetical protein
VLAGVREYDSGKFTSLRYTENDAEELAKVLENRAGFSVRVLTTTRGARRKEDRPTADNLRAAVKVLLARKKRGDTILVALAGHGMQARVKEGGVERDESFFCPSDAQFNDTETLLGLTKLFSDLDGCGAGVKLLLVDACRNEPGARGFRNFDTDAVPRPARGTAALFSCSSGQRAFETDELGPKGHGVFFHFVLEGLKGEARNRDNEVTWASLADHVTRSVNRTVPKLIGGGAKQTPHLLTNLEGESPVLIGPDGGEARKEDSPARAKVVKGTVFGGVEIGAMGVKATVIEATPGPNGLRVKPLFAGTFITRLAASIGRDGTVDPRALAIATNAIKEYVEEIESKYKVPKENIFLVGSSGIFSSIEEHQKAVLVRLELAQAIKKVTGRTMDFITVQREAELSIIGIVPRSFQDSSLLIDIGSGNTKGGYFDGTTKYITFDIPFGSVTFTRAAEKHSKDLIKGNFAAATYDLRPALRAQIKEHPSLTRRERVYLSGGACWALANLVKPGDRGGYAVLSAKDIDAYHRMLTMRPEKFPVVDLSSLSKKDREAAEKDIARIKKTFTPAQLLSGAEILKTLSSEMKLEGKKLYFARNGYLGWILAYAALKTKAS